MSTGRKQANISNQLILALHGIAIVFVIARLLFAYLYTQINYWGAFFGSIIGAVIWLWIYFRIRKVHQDLLFALGVIETVAFCLISIITIGWNSGTYLFLITLLTLVMTNGKISIRLRTFYCCMLALGMMALFILSKIFGWDRFAGTITQDVIFIISLVTACITMIIVAYQCEVDKNTAQAEIVSANEQLTALASTDPLTNLLNRRVMTEYLLSEKEKVDSGGKPFTLVMIDVDNFKQINDQFGHDAGDFVLVILSEKLRLAVRKNDLISRWGGDEFLVMLRETDVYSGQNVAEKIRNRVSYSPFVYREKDIPVTITLGVSVCDHQTGIGNALRKADQALLVGKQTGKNRSVSG